MLNFVEIDYIIPLQEAMCKYNKTQVSLYDPTKLAIHSILRPEDSLLSNCAQNFKTTLSFDDIWHFIYDENFMTYVEFDCGITFYHETPTKFRQIYRERNYTSRSCEEPKCNPNNDQNNCLFDKQHISNIF